MTAQEFLDSVQYSEGGLEAYQQVFGRDFISPGGPDSARELVASLGLPRGSLVLDVCCGVGGSAFLMAQEFGLRVEGLDLSNNMLKQARERCRELGLESQVSFLQGDCLELDIGARYDAVYSRDAFMHISDKARLLNRLEQSLKPGGKLLFTDYCCGPRPWTPEFEQYLSQRHYHMASVEEYVKLLEAAGFTSVEGQNRQSEFVAILETELTRMAQLQLAPEEVEGLKASWLAKLERARRGEHTWGRFQARKS